MPEAASSITRERVRHPLAVRHLEVARKTQLTPHLVRITLVGDELAGFTSLGPADHVKLFFPDASGTLTTPVVTAEGIRRPEEGEIIARDYTPHEYRSESGELDIDFVLHGDKGPASAWAARAEKGDQLAVAGPRGSHLPPDNIRSMVIVADESAFSAALRWIDGTPTSVPVTALLVAANPKDFAYFPDDLPADLRWFAGEGRAEEVADELRGLSFDEGTFVFLAGEAGLIAPLRRYLRRELNLPKVHMDAQGYWKQGVAELDHHAPLDPSDPD
ncbi:siderophore-interacting protein [Actinomyces minihominis]|uniref:siderophore-interacting protein n=1 Tax=Actinomyces minihominis TaxID=2002838 RepID=UPI000C085234|nr:siderophore-interacting protein [Actinomyces minihominis]